MRSGLIIEALTCAIGSGSAILIPKFITSNGVYLASDDNADGYSQVTVNVTPAYPICPKAEIDDIVGIVDPEYTDEEDEGDIKCTGTYIFDTTEGYALVCITADNGHLLWVGRVWSGGTSQVLYSNSSDLTFAYGYVSSVDSSTGTFSVTYAFTFDPSRTRTISRTSVDWLRFKWSSV